MTNNTSSRFLIRDGKFFRETTVISEVVIPDGVLEGQFLRAGIKVANVIAPSAVSEMAMSVGANFSPDYSFLSVRLSKLKFRCPLIAVSDGKRVCPDFGSHRNSGPMFDLWWTPPPDMKVVLMVEMLSRGTQMSAVKSWLFATDESQKIYRLPTGNVYDNCELCTGAFSSGASSMSEVLALCVNQLLGSHWQGDLLSDQSRTDSMKMFMFKPNERSGFDQLPIECEWATLCKVVGNQVITKNVNV